MHVFGVLRVLLYSHMLLEALGLQKSMAGLVTVPSQRNPTNRAPSRHHLPSYMMHLYRTFTSNQTRAVEFIEEDAIKQADTVRSIMAKSKFFCIFGLCYFSLKKKQAHRPRVGIVNKIGW